MTETYADRPGTTRRRVLQAAAVAGLAAGTGPLLAACGSTSSSSTPPAGGGAVPVGTTLGPASDVEVGGGVVYPEEKIVVTQPTAGDFLGFTAICTHQGCTVAEVTDGQIVCPCHGSHYSITDGSVVSGPAPRPLAPVTVSVKGADLVTG